MTVPHLLLHLHSEASPAAVRRVLLALCLPALGHAGHLTSMMVQLRQNATRLGACGGALFDGERLLALVEGPHDAVADLLAALEHGAPAQALGVQRHGLFEQALDEAPSPPWQLGFVAPEQLSACLGWAELAQRCDHAASIAHAPRDQFLATLAQAERA